MQESDGIKRIYFVRHGESTENVGRSYEGMSAKLTPEGERQAEAVAGRFKNIDFDIIITSPMVRARRTAEAIVKVSGKPLKEIHELHEVLIPSSLLGKGIGHEKFDDFVKNRKEYAPHNEEWQYEDEETFKDLKVRAKKVIHLLEKQKEMRIVVVTHGTFLRGVIGTMLQGEKFSANLFYRMREFFSMENTGITVCEYMQSPKILWHAWGPVEGWRLITWNDIAHFG